MSGRAARASKRRKRTKWVWLDEAAPFNVPATWAAITARRVEAEMLLNFALTHYRYTQADPATDSHD